MAENSGEERHKLLRAIPILPSLDLARTLEFCTSKLGMMAAGRYDDYLVVQRDGVRLHFWFCEDAKLPGTSSCYFIVEGIEGLFEELSQRAVEFGYPLRLQPYGMKEFMVIDPDGNGIRFGSIAEN
jgi:catechol 2,3-dioxygenase-like lactoylglutathione lyase family enzyme